MIYKVVVIVGGYWNEVDDRDQVFAETRDKSRRLSHMIIAVSYHKQFIVTLIVQSYFVAVTGCLKTSNTDTSLRI